MDLPAAKSGHVVCIQTWSNVNTKVDRGNTVLKTTAITVDTKTVNIGQKLVWTRKVRKARWLGSQLQSKEAKNAWIYYWKQELIWTLLTHVAEPLLLVHTCLKPSWANYVWEKIYEMPKLLKFYWQQTNHCNRKRGLFASYRDVLQWHSCKYCCYPLISN